VLNEVDNCSSIPNKPGANGVQTTTVMAWARRATPTTTPTAFST
jgi:hypothetical protein